MRGDMPKSIYTDHVASRWECDQSHGGPNSLACLDDYYYMSPVLNRNRATNMSVKDASKMHITSRFAGISSNPSSPETPPGFEEWVQDFALADSPKKSMLI
jgi:hypothetical protein